MYIDTHAHINDEAYNNESPENLLKRAKEDGVKYVIAPGVNIESSRQLKDYSEKFPGVFFASGIHAHEASKFYEKDFLEIKHLLEHPKAVAVGEVGLDYHYEFSSRTLQKHVLSRFLKLAISIDMPMIIHCREAEEDFYSMLKEMPKIPRGVIHCYTGDVKWAKKFLDMGFYLGFTGIITFNKSEEMRDVVRNTPIDRILTETDSPYMTPSPRRKIRPNEPRFVTFVADKIAEIKGLKKEEALPVFVKNAEKCFGIELK
ncbi:MAG: TatD family hydrolase [Candidatus Eremiobacteraeota bacterium]|nr:TatD family hydrolase [Candidatus Eremiobacteraeota bacterium]